MAVDPEAAGEDPSIIDADEEAATTDQEAVATETPSQEVTIYANQVTVLDTVEPYAATSPSYGVGTSNVSIFERVVQKLPYGCHYVYWREGQYEYRLAYSEDLTLSGTTFRAPSATVVSYTTSSGYNEQPTWDEWTESSLTVNAGDLLVYSDLGNYPTLYARGGVDYAQLACVILCSFALYYLWHHLWADIRQRFV